jgi:hypothetical protein
LSITVQLPPLRRTPKGRAAQAGEGQQRPRKFFRPVAVIPIIVAVLGIALFTDIGRGSDNPAVPEASALRTEPSFLPLLPAAEESSATHYDAKRNLVSYTTSFSGSRITVSQQPIPENFKGDSNALSKAAEKISATQRVDTDRGPVYMYTNDKNGEQLAVHAGEGVLLFIRTDTALNESAWKSFIEQLQPKDWNGQG